MMIRINLLPVRAVKKQELGRQVLILAAVLFVGALIGNYFWYSSRDSVQVSGSRKLTATQQEIAKLDRIIGEVNNIARERKDVEDKLKVLRELEKGRSGPVRLMDALATATPKKVWLKNFEEASNAVKLQGTAVSNDDVAEFMHGLANVVWTPKGMGRLVEQKRDAKTSRVELLNGGGTIEDFRVDEVGSFFTNIDLKTATQAAPGGTGNGPKLVDFEIGLTANYAI